MTQYTINRTYPKPLPHRIVLSDGTTRTDNTTFTDAEIADAGYTAVSDMPSHTNDQKVFWNGADWYVQDRVGSEYDVRNYAQELILGYCPEWKQRNITNRSMELVQKGSDNWTAEELAEYNANQAIWTKIKEIRDASNTLEAMSPIPHDYWLNEHWPSNIGM